MLYAAYGSNMNLKQMAFRCPDSKVVGTGYILDYKLKFAYHADIIPSKGDKVPVVLWNVPELDFRTLDIYEGVKGGYYKRVTLPVKTKKGIMKDAIVYVMCGEHEWEMPSESYYLIIKEGYEDNKISRKFLFDSVVECAREVGMIVEEN